jgi:hypothetical protein
MASKRTRNRLYWVTVKAVANGDRTALDTYARLIGLADSTVVPTLDRLESDYGPARLADVSRSELWPARAVVESVKA